MHSALHSSRGTSRLPLRCFPTALRSRNSLQRFPPISSMSAHQYYFPLFSTQKFRSFWNCIHSRDFSNVVLYVWLIAAGSLFVSRGRCVMNCFHGGVIHVGCLWRGTVSISSASTTCPNRVSLSRIGHFRPIVQLSGT